MTKPIRVAVTGAAGQISYSLLFRIASGVMFGPDHPVYLSLLEVRPAQRILDPLLMELDDCAFPLLTGIKASFDAAEAFEGADWIILIGSVPYRPEIPRSELLRANAPIFQEQGRAINESAPSARILTVANPCNTNCLIAKSMAPNVPPEHWFAMTRLDQNRAKALIAAKARVSLDQISRVTVWGNHSPTVYPDFHNAFIGGRPAHEVIRDEEWVAKVFEPTVCHRGLQLLRVRGASPAGSAAQAIIGTIRAIICPTPFEQRFSAAVVSDGSYRVPRGLIFGFPLRTEDGTSWSIVQGLYHEDYGLNRIAQNIAELEQEAAIVVDLLGNIIPDLRLRG
jgi:malate dehydrogenase